MLRCKKLCQKRGRKVHTAAVEAENNNGIANHLIDTHQHRLVSKVEVALLDSIIVRDIIHSKAMTFKWYLLKLLLFQCNNNNNNNPYMP